ncbi:MAG: hypothetical protein ACE5DI_00800 [Candidatus Micrarchaeia archaeon]
MDIVAEKVVSLKDVENVLNKRKKEGEDALSYEQQNTLEYVEKFADKLSDEKAKSLKKELEKIGLTEKMTIKIVDLLPKKEEEVRVVVLQDRVELSDDQVKAIVKAVKDVA